MGLQKQRDQRYVGGCHRQSRLSDVGGIHQRYPLNALSFCLSMILLEKPVPTFPDHALSQIPREQMAAGSTATRRAWRRAPARKLFCVVGRPVQSRVLLPLPTCQNEGFPRDFTPLTRR